MDETLFFSILLHGYIGLICILQFWHYALTYSYHTTEMMAFKYVAMDINLRMIFIHLFISILIVMYLYHVNNVFILHIYLCIL